MKKIFLLIFLLIIAIVVKAAAEEAEEEFEYKTVIKTVDGIRFNVPEDRPIIRKGGMIVPMELDEYVAMKFAKVEKQMDLVKASIENLRKDIHEAMLDGEATKGKITPLEDGIALIKKDLEFVKKDIESTKEDIVLKNNDLNKKMSQADENFISVNDNLVSIEEEIKIVKEYLKESETAEEPLEKE